MKKDEGFSKMEASIKMSMKLLPFGSVSCEILGLEHRVKTKDSEAPVYIEPHVTGIEKVEIQLDEANTYSVPKTTG